MTEGLKRTPLFEVYGNYDAKIVPFAGWEMPIEFKGITEEHKMVRTSAGIFDVSHMGEIEVKGKDAEAFCQKICTNDISKLHDNQILYSFMCYENGTVVDDILVYRFSQDNFMLVVNAGNISKDYEWIVNHATGYEVDINNVSDNIGQVAIQGPKAEAILQKFTDIDLSEIKFFYSLRNVDIKGINTIVSRTGYTGEDGFEIYCEAKDSVKLWKLILEESSEEEIIPIGLGARDTLRFEANLPLYGNELSDEITPIEAGYGYFVKLDKDDFIGKEALMAQKSGGLKRKIVGFELLDKRISRHGYEVYSENDKIGVVTTGYQSPTLQKSIGLALIDAQYVALGNEIYIDIRNKKVPAKIVSRNFYKK
ncbi:glycine cleavage system aminomethyltransferase GcvT [Acetoanaerobium noterae]|uniref:glycine cleavage system aminomethyltransferase GcvT n=1 Tax=Acetoanaerobium noterae TaxID=745369 RepID=UPI003340D408